MRVYFKWLTRKETWFTDARHITLVGPPILGELTRQVLLYIPMPSNTPIPVDACFTKSHRILRGHPSLPGLGLWCRFRRRGIAAIGCIGVVEGCRFPEWPVNKLANKFFPVWQDHNYSNQSIWLSILGNHPNRLTDHDRPILKPYLNETYTYKFRITSLRIVETILEGLGVQPRVSKHLKAGSSNNFTATEQIHRIFK